MRQAQASASHTYHLQEGRPPVVLLLLNSRDSDPFLTETHECLLGPQLPQDQVGPPSHSTARAAAGPLRMPITETNATSPDCAGRGRGHGAPPFAGTPLGPVALAHHLWQDSSSSSANVPSLRASILNSLRLMKKHSFFNGE